MIDKKHIGSEGEPLVVDVELGQLTFFAKASAESNPVYSHEAAKAAGFKAVPAPHTFVFSLNLAHRNLR